MLSMRSILLALFASVLASMAGVPAFAEPGTKPERIARASQVDEEFGAVVMSIRSEIYLDDPVQVFFLREGGRVENDADVIRFGRRQGFFAFGNDTLGFQVRAYQLRPGTYRLVAHGMNCPKVPEEDERCLIDETGLLGTVERSRPSRGYPEVAPSFEVQAGAVTYAGDFILTARNRIEWLEIPPEKLSRIRPRFDTLARGPEPLIPDDYRLKYGLNARSYEDDAGRLY